MNMNAGTGRGAGDEPDDGCEPLLLPDQLSVLVRARALGDGAHDVGQHLVMVNNNIATTRAGNEPLCEQAGWLSLMIHASATQLHSRLA